MEADPAVSWIFTDPLLGPVPVKSGLGVQLGPTHAQPSLLVFCYCLGSFLVCLCFVFYVLFCSVLSVPVQQDVVGIEPLSQPA